MRITAEKMEAFAKAGYESYRADTGGISLATGARIPDWHMLTPKIQAAWRAATAGVLAAYTIAQVASAASADGDGI